MEESRRGADVSARTRRWGATSSLSCEINELCLSLSLFSSYSRRFDLCTARRGHANFLSRTHGRAKRHCAYELEVHRIALNSAVIVSLSLRHFHAKATDDDSDKALHYATFG